MKLRILYVSYLILLNLFMILAANNLLRGKAHRIQVSASSSQILTF